MRVLVVDDSETARRALRRGLPTKEYEIAEASNGEEAWVLYEKNPFPLVVTDWSMEGSVDGIELIRRIKAAGGLPYSYVILVTGAHKDDLKEGLNAGADAFVTKPVEKDDLRARAAAARRILSAFDQVRDLRRQVRQARHTDEILEGSHSAVFKKALALAEQVAPTVAAVLLLGETGTGKEVIARRIHDYSARKDGPFIPVNCGAIPEALIESELFGHEPGAFTGATSLRIGKFEQAQGGTIFLDEIGDLPPPQQVKLLRVLQESTCDRVGGTSIGLDVRVIAATHHDLAKKVTEGKFREDLYYRINVVPITLPPLRDRRDDISPLARQFLTRFARETQRADIEGISAAAEALLHGHHWPGNIRELLTLIQYAVIVAKGPQILPDDLRPKLPPSRATSPAATLEDSSPIDFDAAVKDFKREKLRWALRLANNKRKEAGKLLGGKTPDDVRYLIQTLLPESEASSAE